MTITMMTKLLTLKITHMAMTITMSNDYDRDNNKVTR